MKEFLKKVFTSKAMFISSAVLALFFWALWGTFCINVANLYELTTDAVFYFLIIVSLLYAYVKGETNVQKVLIGALFMLIINSNIEILYTYLKSGDMTVVIIDYITMTLALAIFISHIILQSDHVGTSKAIVFNQFCGLILTVILFYLIRQLFFIKPVNILDVTYIPAWGLTYLLIICIETRVQMYKKMRFEAIENGSWNDETRKKAKELFIL